MQQLGLEASRRRARPSPARRGGRPSCATCSAAPAGDPPARMKRRSGGSSPSSASIQPSSRAMSSPVTAAFVTRSAMRAPDRPAARRWRTGRAGSARASAPSPSSVQARDDQAEPGVQLVDVAVRGDARVRLRDPRAVEEPGVAAVAGPGVDFHRPQLFHYAGTWRGDDRARLSREKAQGTRDNSFSLIANTFSAFL